jgi:hypothetical protein
LFSVMVTGRIFQIAAGQENASNISPTNGKAFQRSW